MKLLGTLFGVLLMTIGASASWADGMKDGPAPVAAVGCGGPFSGYYAGGQVGYIDHDAKFHDELGGGHVDGDDNGATFGIYAGYNVQCGRLLYGIESDFNFADSEASVFDPCCAQENSSEMNWFSSTRLRLGVVHNDKLLFYVTGGLAYADLDHTFAVGAFNFYQKNSDINFGYTIGGGIELIHVTKWSVKAEVLYADLGTEKVDYTLGGGCIVCVARIGHEDEFVTARIGLAYHFGRREEEAAPLK